MVPLPIYFRHIHHLKTSFTKSEVKYLLTGWSSQSTRIEYFSLIDHSYFLSYISRKNTGILWGYCREGVRKEEAQLGVVIMPLHRFMMFVLLTEKDLPLP